MIGIQNGSSRPVIYFNSTWDIIGSERKARVKTETSSYRINRLVKVRIGNMKAHLRTYKPFEIPPEIPNFSFLRATFFPLVIPPSK
jgi:hypothetical protein